MMTKTAYYMQMAQEAAAQITGSTVSYTHLMFSEDALKLFLDLMQSGMSYEDETKSSAALAVPDAVFSAAAAPAFAAAYSFLIDVYKRQALSVCQGCKAS